MRLKELLKKYRGLIIFLCMLVILTPFAFIIAEHFNFGDAWGEWGAETLQEIAGFVPEGMKSHEGIYDKAPLPDYSAPGLESKGVLVYFISGVTGVGVIFLIFFVSYKLFYRRKD